MLRNIKFIIACLLILVATGCKKYLDIIPDNIATLDHAFATRVTTERYLITCYSWLPREADASYNPAFLSGEEFWTWNILTYPEGTQYIAPFRVARGEQNTNNPLLNYYEGNPFNNYDGSLWRNIRRCNTMIERVDGVFELTQQEKDIWKAEAKVIKAYTMYYLMRMYGPIPIVNESLPISAEPEQVRYKRAPFQEGIDFIVNLIDEAAPHLMPKIEKRNEELGRITRPIALTIKANALMLAASPQFNGNPYYSTWRNKDGEMLFGARDEAKWARAATACKEAIDAAETAGARLYREYNPLGNFSAAETSEYTTRGKVTNELWSEELIWGEVTTNANTLQSISIPYLDGRMIGGGHMHLLLAVNMKVANQFYSNHGVPIDEDNSWAGKVYSELRTANTEENAVIKGTTANVNFEREPRYYGSLGFDRGVWYGNGNGNGQSGLNPWILLGLKNQAANKNGTGERSGRTGYFAKKLININTTMRDPNTFSPRRYPFPIYRLADLYLLYAEALNESSGPGSEAYAYIDSVRKRAGLNGVVESWAQYSRVPEKPLSKDGLRQIIQRERMIEMSFEGKRFWDLRRWLLAERYMNEPVIGWNVNGETPESYYLQQTIFLPKFTPRDYLWPIRQEALTINPNMVQAPGW